MAIKFIETIPLIKKPFFNFKKNNLEIIKYLNNDSKYQKNKDKNDYFSYVCNCIYLFKGLKGLEKLNNDLKYELKNDFNTFVCDYLYIKKGLEGVIYYS